MSIGPVEYIAIAFPGNKFSGKIVPALEELVDNGTIKILDLVIIHKDGDGNVDAIELSEADEVEAATLSVLGVEGRKLLGQEDVEEISDALEPNSSCALMIWENVWAARFAGSLRDADGILIANGRIPAALVEEALSEATPA